ncbi:MAG: hypothetical protein WC777_02660 [Candidatus Gracilibacteria bacterium]
MSTPETPIDYEELSRRTFPDVEAFLSCLEDEYGLDVSRLTVEGQRVSRPLSPLAYPNAQGQIAFAAGVTVTKEIFRLAIDALSVKPSTVLPTQAFRLPASIGIRVADALRRFPTPPEAEIGEARGILIERDGGYFFMSEAGQEYRVVEEGLASLERVFDADDKAALLRGSTEIGQQGCRPLLLVELNPIDPSPGIEQVVTKFWDPEEYES